MSDAENRPESTQRLPPPIIEAEPVKAEKPRRRGNPILLVFAVLVAAFAGAAIERYVLPLFGGASKGGAALEAQVAALRSQIQSADIAGMKSRIAALEAKAAASTGASAEIAQIAGRLAAAEQSLAALGASASATPLPTGEGTAIAPGALAEFEASRAALKNQISDVSAHLDAAESALKSANAALSDRLASLEQRIPANLTQQLLGLAGKGDIEALALRLHALEANTAALDAKRAAASMALANLARSANSGAPFARELEAIKYLEVDPSLISPLAGFADKGVRPASDLIAEYDDVSREALKASRASNKDAWGAFWAHVTNIFFIRRTGTMAGASAQAILLRAGNAAHAGNLKGAVAELSSLKGVAGAEMAAWRKEANARVELDHLMATLTTRLVASLNAKAAP